MSGTVLFAGGGTGGHLFPGVAVAEEWIRRDEQNRALFAGSDRESELRLIGELEFEHVALPVEPSTTIRKRPWRFVQRNFAAYRQAKNVLRESQPIAVVGLGGFASVPVVWAASRFGIPVVLLEQNVIPGRATRWLSRRAEWICTSFEETAGHLPKRTRTTCVGNPVRAEIAELAEANSESLPDLQNTLLVLGGSQGSEALNSAVVSMVETAPSMFSKWRIVHQTGREQESSVRARYDSLGIDATVSNFLDDMPKWYRVSKLVISRAGATTLAEIACAGLPAVLVPYPRAIYDHQTVNAHHFADAGAARRIVQAERPEETAAALAEVVHALIVDSRSELAAMSESMRKLARPQAARRVADEIERVASCM